VNSKVIASHESLSGIYIVACPLAGVRAGGDLQPPAAQLLGPRHAAGAARAEPDAHLPAALTRHGLPRADVRVARALKSHKPLELTPSIVAFAAMYPPDTSGKVCLYPVMLVWVLDTILHVHAGLVLPQSTGVLGDRVLAVLRGSRGVRAARRGAVRLATGAGAGVEPGMRRIRAVAPFQRL